MLGVYRERVLSLTQSSAPSHCNIITKNYCIGAVSFLPPSLLPLFALVLSFHFLSISVDTRQACREVNHISRHGAGMSRGESADTGQACRGVSDRQGEATRAANAPSIRRLGAGIVVCCTLARIIFEAKRRCPRHHCWEFVQTGPSNKPNVPYPATKVFWLKAFMLKERCVEKLCKAVVCYEIEVSSFRSVT